MGAFEIRRNLTTDFGSLEIGQTQVEHHEIRRAVGNGTHGGHAGPGHVDLVAGRAQQRPDRALDCHFVVDEQDARWPIHFTSAGTTIVNRAPPSAQFSAEIRPPTTASTPCAIARPIPVPDRRDLASAPR